jgi:hypothetical protein
MKELLEVTDWSIWLKAMTFGSMGPGREGTRVNVSAGLLDAMGRNPCWAPEEYLLVESPCH